VIIAHSQGTIIASVVLQFTGSTHAGRAAQPEVTAFAVPFHYAEPVSSFRRIRS